MDSPDDGFDEPVHDAASTLRALLSPALARIVDRPRVVDEAAAGWGHVAFAAWLVAAMRPRLVVSIARRPSALHAALCQAMARDSIPGEVIAFDPPGLHDAVTRSFPSLARTIDLPAPGLPLPVRAGSVDLLHADPGLWRAGQAVWRASLAERGVLLLHGHGQPGADEPGLAFLHDGGLRVLPAGRSPHPALLPLLAAAAEPGPRLAALRTRFEWFGERWRLEALASRSRDEPGAARLLEALRDRVRLEAEARRIPVLEAERADARRHADQLAGLLADRDREIRALLTRPDRPQPPRGPAPAPARASRWWSRPAPASGAAGAAAPSTPVTPAEPAPMTRPEPTAPASRSRRRRILFVAGEPDTAGAEFRARRAAAAAAAAGHESRWVRIEDVDPEAIRDLDLLVIWRAGWSGHVQTMIELARAAGTAIAYDVDDLIVDPALARPEVIDGIRTLGVAADHLAGFFAAQQRTLLAADFAVATTAELAFQLRLQHPAALVIPNGFDDLAHDLARLERRARALAAPDGLMRIGYAAGTRSHQRDFALAAPALARVMRARPETRLVLFRDIERGDMLVTDDFPALDGLADRIEWRDTVAVERLGAEIARFGIAICPVETGNPFCEAKSEVKFTEAALAQIPCVASPTGPFRRAIAHGRTGLLADGEQAWYDALLTLVDEPDTRARLGQAAYCDVLWRFGPQRAARDWDSVLRALDGPREAAREAELRIARDARPRTPVPAIPPTDLLFAADTLRAADVSVAITSFNYEPFIEEALDSAAAQTLAALELVVVDDGSTDGSVERILAWARAHTARFTRVRIERTRANAGLGPARNAAFAAAETPWVMSLDADNRLRPACCAALLDEARRAGAAFAYPALERFGDASPPISAAAYDPIRLIPGNYIDAMALIAKWAWAAAGGFYDRHGARGWEDYGLFCRLAELGQFGVWHQAVLADYRVHAGSMTNTLTETPANKNALVDFFEQRHPWLHLRSRAANPR